MAYPRPIEGEDARSLYKQAMFFYDQYEKKKKEKEILEEKAKEMEDDLSLFVEAFGEDWLKNNKSIDKAEEGNDKTGAVLCKIFNCPDCGEEFVAKITDLEPVSPSNFPWCTKCHKEIPVQGYSRLGFQEVVEEKLKQVVKVLQEELLIPDGEFSIEWKPIKVKGMKPPSDELYSLVKSKLEMDKLAKETLYPDTPKQKKTTADVCPKCRGKMEVRGPGTTHWYGCPKCDPVGKEDKD